jgi:branched-chain amino acid transport system ATP-binding protein
VVKELYDIVEKISQAGTTVILVEQDVKRGLNEANHVYCLLEGKVSLAGKPAEISPEQVSRAYFGM